MSNQPASASPQVFHCPNCGAGLPAPQASTVRCTYCNTNVLVPPEYLPNREKEPQPWPAEPLVIKIPLHSTTASATPKRSNSILNAIIFMVILFAAVGGVMALVGGMVAAGAGGLGLAVADRTINGLEATQAIATPTVQAVPTEPPFAELLLQFGGKGSAAGQFDDSRYITLDLDGNIYVGEYANGRVQKFSPEGKFLRLIQVEPDRNGNAIIRDLTSGTEGIYVVRGGDILVYNTDGDLVNTIPGSFPDPYYDSLAVDLANNLYGVSTSAGEVALLKLNPEGEELFRQEAINTQVGSNNPMSRVRLATDGSGNVLVLNQIGGELYLFNSEGRFTDRLATKGEALGQLSNPMSLTADGQGRIYVTDTGGLLILNKGGGFLKTIEWDYSLGSPFDLTVDTDGNLFVVTNMGQVLKFRLGW